MSGLTFRNRDYTNLAIAFGLATLAVGFWLVGYYGSNYMAKIPALHTSPIGFWDPFNLVAGMIISLAISAVLAGICACAFGIGNSIFQFVRWVWPRKVPEE